MKESLYSKYREIRDGSNILEVKGEGKGVMSWCTRGQLSINAKIMAATGFQKGDLNLQEVHDLFLEALQNDREITFIQERLRSGKDIFIRGGHVTKVFSDRIFRLLYDNKRVIIDVKDKTLLDSRPLDGIEEGELLRLISKLPKTSQYTRNMSNLASGKYKSKLELVIRNFLKALLKNELNLKIELFKNYSEVIRFIKTYNSDFAVTEDVLSQLKRRGKFNKVRRTADSELFVDYIKTKFPNFDEVGFYKGK